MEKIVLAAKKRENKTKSSRNILRNSGRSLGVYYSRHNDSIAIDVSEKELKPLVFTTATHLINLQIEGESEHDCILKDVQFDPITDKVVHFDLMGLIKGEKFQLEVPLIFKGNPIGVKEGGVLQYLIHKLDIECLPKDIPPHLEIDIHNLKIEDSIHVEDISFENITILNSADSVIVSVTHPKLETVETSEEEGEEKSTEPEVINKDKEQEK